MEIRGLGTPVEIRRTGVVERLEAGLVPVESLPPELAARRTGYLTGVSNDIAGLRGLELPALDTLAVEGTLRQAFATSGEELGPAAMAAGTAFARGSGPVEAPATATPELADLAARLKRLFPKIDKNQDGKLSTDEIYAALDDKSIKGKDGAALVVLSELVGELQWLSHDDRQGSFDQGGVTLADLDKLGKGDTGEFDRVTKGSKPGLLDRAGKKYAYYQKSLQGQSQSLFEGMPDPNSIQQGQIGDCFFLAALVAYATRNPQAVKDMIKSHPDGSYTVTFPGKPPVHISALTDAEKAMAAKSNGLWAAVLEKAYAKLTHSGHPMTPGYMGSADTGVDTFSSKQSRSIFLSEHKPADIRQKLIQALKAGKLVEAGCMSPSLKGLVAGHAYTVLSFDDKSDQIRLRNPWGDTEPGNDGKDDGIFVLSFQQFMANFYTLGIEA